jgi:hypothetical protein
MLLHSYNAKSFGQSALALLVPRVGTNHEDNATAANDLAVLADSFNAGSDFHGSSSLNSLG